MKIRTTFANGLRQTPKDFDFAVFPNIVFSKPPEDVKIIDREKSFALALEWGHWAVVVWFIKEKI